MHRDAEGFAAGQIFLILFALILFAYLAVRPFFLSLTSHAYSGRSWTAAMRPEVAEPGFGLECERVLVFFTGS